MLADQLDYIVGVDPHRDSHALAIVHVQSGAVVFEAMVLANSDGYAEALRLVEERASGRRAFAVEGTGSFGAGLTRFLIGRGEQVLEGRSVAPGTSHGRQDRRPRRRPCGPERPCQRAACDAACGRRTPGVAGIGGCTRRSSQRQTGRALPAA
jgi:hypothetical protein